MVKESARVVSERDDKLLSEPTANTEESNTDSDDDTMGQIDL